MQLDGDIVARVLENVLLIVGLGLAAGVLGGIIAAVHRWYARTRVPEGLAVLVGLSGVALSLQTTSALGSVITDPATGESALAPATIVVNTLAFGVSAVAAAGAVARATVSRRRCFSAGPAGRST